MEYVNTGIERCKTFRIDRRVGGASLSGYPKDYDILSAFTAGGNSYSVISEVQFQQLHLLVYEWRLANFKTYIETAEGIASVDGITDSRFPASKTNTTVCPIGVQTLTNKPT